MEIWDRYYELQIGSLLITIDDLDVEFKVENSNKENAGKAEIAIYNLSSSKSKIRKDMQVQLKAGYRDDYGIIFYGNIDRVSEEREGGDVKTVINALDSTKALFEQAKIVKTYPAGTSIESIVREMFSISSIPIARIDDPGIVLQKDMTFVGTPYMITQQIVKMVNGEVAKGIALDAYMRRQISDTMFTAYIENNMGYFVRKDFKGRQAIILSSETGLMEVLEQEDENTETNYRIRCLLNWKCRTNTLIKLESVKASGLFKVVKYSHTCKGEDYYSELEVKAV